MSTARLIVIDFNSVTYGMRRQTGKLAGVVVAGLPDYVRAEQAKGSTIFFIAGSAYEGFMRQLIENFLEQAGIKKVYVTHGLPDGYDLFISTKAFLFNGHTFPE